MRCCDRLDMSRRICRRSAGGRFGHAAGRRSGTLSGTHPTFSVKCKSRLPGTVDIVRRTNQLRRVGPAEGRYHRRPPRPRRIAPARRTRRSTRSSRSSTRSASAARGRARSSSRGPASGAAIVAQRVGELIDRGLVTEGDVGPSTGGRPPRQLTFRADGGHVLVADLGATSIDVARHHASTAGSSATTTSPAEIEAGPGALPRPRRRPVRRRSLRTTQGRARDACGASASACPGPVEFETGRPDLAADHARLGRLPDPRTVRRALRRAGLGRQRRQRPGARGVALGRRRRPRQRRRRQGRDGHRGRHHLRRPPPSRRPGQRRRRRPHPGRRRPGRRLPLRQRRLPRGARRRRGARARRRGRRRSTAAARACGSRSTSTAR